MTSAEITPQFDEQAERAVLGALLNSSQDALGGVDSLQEDSFYLDSHRRVWRARAIVDLAASGIDLLMVRDQLRKTGDLDAIGGLAYLMDLQDCVPRGFQPEAAVARIRECWRRRRGLHLCVDYRARFQDKAEDAADVLADLQADVFDVMQDSPGQVDPHVSVHTPDALNEFLSPEPPVGDSYGLPKVDAQTGGMKPGEVTVVGAASGVGKSSLMCQAIAEACGMRGEAVDCFSYEMPRRAVLRRLWSIRSQVPYAAILYKRCNVTDRERVKQAAYEIAEWPLRIHDDARMTLSQMCSLARLSARRNAMRMFCVDYAQIVPAEGKDERIRVATISRTLTALAKNENVHLMLLSQLSRPGGQGPARAPRLSDLRETSQLENDAHVVLLLHRPWDDATGGLGHSAEIIIPKQRNGATGTIASNFNARTLTFE